MISNKLILIALLIISTNLMQSQTTTPELKQLQSEMIDYALEIGEIFETKLDFTDESIKKVEKILSEIHKEYKQTKNDEGLNGIAIQFGFYIMEVIERNHGKAWVERNHESIGENSFPFYWNGGTLFPYGWCQKRIFDGEGDNIWVKYQILVLEKETE
jgi:hypothetical protein